MNAAVLHWRILPGDKLDEIILEAWPAPQEPEPAVFPVDDLTDWQRAVFARARHDRELVATSSKPTHTRGKP